MTFSFQLISTFARKLGCSYESATNGLIALETYKTSEKRFDYVLMGGCISPLCSFSLFCSFLADSIFSDLSMPVMDGVTSSSKIREFEKENRIPPSCIMAITGVASAEMQQQARSAGIDDYLVKPVSLQALRKVMKIP